MSTTRTAKPADITVVLATASAAMRWSAGRVPADSVAFVLRELGFTTTAQQAAAYLKRLARLDAPPIEVCKAAWSSWTEYRVTTFGRTWIRNTLPGVELLGDFQPPAHTTTEEQR